MLQDQRFARLCKQGTTGIAAQRTGELKGSDHGGGNDLGLHGIDSFRQCRTHKFNQVSDSATRFLLHRIALASHFRSQSCNDTPILCPLQVRVMKIRPNERGKPGVAFGHSPGHRLRKCSLVVATCLLHCFDQKCVTRSKVSIEAAVRETCFFHDVSNPNATVASSTNCACCHFNDALVALFFTR